ncbi:lipocalin-like domain-containing protein [Rhizobium grahamii]|uniref:Putative attachment protein n=1 Tax=Rhizobium grahamii CCGE 502 TaxID=990285 RepID=S3H8V0_9HYPH|nr:lipocalin-like domain-containing protein [Rhizobium grahamii]EPE94620.1 putative attachment protein [Rhizobium grahamii CCGE 502]
MNVRALIAAALAVVLSCPSAVVLAQGFAGLGSSAEGFDSPKRGVVLSFPADHGPHPTFRIEWWYVTANLAGDDGKSYGAQWTMFRSAMAPGEMQGFADPQIWIGHAAITSAQHHYVAERRARGGIGQADVVRVPFEAWIDDWDMASEDPAAHDPLDRIRIRANGKDFRYELHLEAKGPLVLQGDRGYSVKSAAGQASFYYSQPFYEASGLIDIAGKTVRVHGNAWLDREWSSQPLAADQSGWDWFSLHLATGEKFMAFRLRGDKGGFLSANWIAANGNSTPLSSDAVSIEAIATATVAARTVPVAWRIRVPERSFDVTTRALNDQAWMATSTPYWEGPIFVQGSTSGKGYLEMTGY